MIYLMIINLIFQKMAKKSDKDFYCHLSQVKETQSQMKRLIQNISSSQIIPPPNSTLKISNSMSKYQLRDGKFQTLLQARDQVLEHQFTINEELSVKELQDKKIKFVNSEIYKSLKTKIRKFLVEAISNIVSIAFNFMCKGDLESKQAKDYASKNIMLNLHSVFKNTMNALENHQTLRNYIDLEEVRDTLIIDLDNILNNILVNLADSYPEAPPSGGTPRMRQFISAVNRIDDAENDFIFTSKINISDYISIQNRNSKNEELLLQQEGDYTQFIMNVINKATQVSHVIEDDNRQRTNFQKFTQFNEHLFWMSQEKEYQKLLSTVSEKHKIFDNEDDQKTLKVSAKEKICSYFSDILSRKNENDPLGREIKSEMVLEEEIKTKEESSSKQPISNSKLMLKFDKLWLTAEQGIENMKKNHEHFAFGQKIPNSVKSFSRQQITGKQFTAKHSSILRILTKWAGYLEYIFSNSQRFIKRRLYPFKNVHNQLVNLKRGDPEGEQKLIKQLEEQYIEVQLKFDSLLRSSYGFIGKILKGEEQNSFASNVSRYTQTRVISSKINAVLTSLMLNYTNLLIHHLLKAGRKILTDRKVQNISLVVFRICDLMRSKLQCSESSFISILKTMYLLDNSEEMRGKFKLVRIKNKLDESANNVMINYLFMDKVICQLQLSIQESKGKEKNYHTFSHFVYQLTRGKFGPIADCAMMISQLDPMISACKYTYYRQKQVVPKLQKVRQNLEQKEREGLIKNLNLIYQHSMNNLIRLKHKTSENTKTPFFECTKCSKLITDENTSKFLSQAQQNHCYQCIIKTDKPEEYLKQNLKKALQMINTKLLRNYRVFKGLKKEKYLIGLSASGQISLNIVLYVPKQFRTFSIKVQESVLLTIDSSDFDFGYLDYVDISKEISTRELNSASSLCYLFDKFEEIPEDILILAGLNIKILEEKVKILMEQFKDFREEKSTVKMIKYKTQILRPSKEQLKTLNKVCSILVPGTNNIETMKEMKYKRFKYLELNTLRLISLKSLEIQQVPKWIKECQNLRKLELDENKIKIVEKNMLPSSLIQLSLFNNGLESIDISSLNNLTLLYLRNNNLTTFDVGSNKSLVELHLHHNKLEKFSIGQNNSLIKLNLGTNSLTEFHIGNNKSLIELHLNKNKLRSIDLSQNTRIQLLSIYQNSLPQMPNLPVSIQLLKADGTQMAKYNFEDLLHLKEIHVFNSISFKREDALNLKSTVKLKNYSRQ